MNYLRDTNIAIYFLQNQFTPKAEAFMEQTLADSVPSISIITEIELLYWKTPSDQNLMLLHVFINGIMVLGLGKAIKLKTAEIREANAIKLPDAIIAATASVYDFTLLTRNVSDFQQVSGLSIINPFDH